MLVRNRLNVSRVKDIHYAAAHNKYERLRYYAFKYAHLFNQLDSEGNTVLHSAVKNASRRTMKLLLRMELDCNILNSAGYSPLHLIIMSSSVGRDECALYMLDGKGFDEDQLTLDGRSCLLLAAEYDRPTILHQLLVDGHDYNVTDYNGTTCLQAACQNGSWAIVKDLLEHGADPNSVGKDGFTPLHDCVVGRNVEVAKMLINYGSFYFYLYLILCFGRCIC